MKTLVCKKSAYSDFFEARKSIFKKMLIKISRKSAFSIFLVIAKSFEVDFGVIVVARVTSYPTCGRRTLETIPIKS